MPLQASRFEFTQEVAKAVCVSVFVSVCLLLDMHSEQGAENVWHNFAIDARTG